MRTSAASAATNETIVTRPLSFSEYSVKPWGICWPGRSRPSFCVSILGSTFFDFGGARTMVRIARLEEDVATAGCEAKVLVDEEPMDVAGGRTAVLVANPRDILSVVGGVELMWECRGCRWCRSDGELDRELLTTMIRV